jgi:hypothetical protein
MSSPTAPARKGAAIANCAAAFQSPYGERIRTAVKVSLTIPECWQRLMAIGRVYIGCIYFAEERAMAKAKLFMSGGSQAVRLSAKFRFEGSEVDIRRDPLAGEVVFFEAHEVMG